MVKVLCVTTSDEGLRFVDAFLFALIDRGYEVHVATRLGERAAVLGRTHGATLHAIPFTRRMTPLEDVVAGYRLLEVTKAVRPDVVHAHNPKGGLWGMLCARACLVPHRIYTVHGLPSATARGARRRLLLRADDAAIALSTRVICVSPSVRAELEKQGTAGRKLTVVGGGSAQGVPTDSFRRSSFLSAGEQFRKTRGIPERAPLLLSIGRLHREKGLERLPAIFEIVRRQFPSAHLAIVGGADPVAPAEMKALSSLPGVVLCGPLSDPRPAYAAADLLVLPSAREGLPTVVLEAASMQVPTVACDVLGSRDAVQVGENGILVPASDDHAFASAVCSLLADSELRRRLGDCARGWVSRFDQEVVVENLLRQYEAWGIRPPSPPRD